MAAATTVASAERRSAGIDRQTVGPALLVLALAVLMSVVLPSIDAKTDYRDQIHQGDVAQVADGITLVPTPGWNLASGALVGRARTPVGTTASTQLVNGGVEFNAQAAPFAGTPQGLLRRVNRIRADLGRARAATNRYRVTTRQGAVGVAEDFAGVNRQGTIAAFVFRSRGQSSREGVEIVVSGPTGAMSRRRDDIVAMIRSIRMGS
jgi:hypothetical protein